MTKEEIIAMVNEYENECYGAEYDGLDTEHLIEFLLKKLSNRG